MLNSPISTFLAALAAAIFASGAYGGTGVPSAPLTEPVSEVESVSLSVSDMERSEQFFSEVLTFEKISDREISGEAYAHLWGVPNAHVRVVRMRLGDEQIELLQFHGRDGRHIPVDSRSNDVWFQHIAIIVADMSAAYERLRSFHVTPTSSAPQRLPDWNPAAAGIQAFYFRDPDGHNLEILAFPPGKGAGKWHAKDGPLFLGIDHTAIVVTKTARSLAYYQRSLGLHVAGTSENYGVEQEHLNHVDGAHLRITSLRAASGPGIEFLEYLEPAGGRPLPADTRAPDLWYWQVNLCTRSTVRLERSLRHEHASVLSATTPLPDEALGWRRALLARDPDGHAGLIGESKSCTRI